MEKHWFLLAEHYGFMKYSLNKPDKIIQINGLISRPPRHAQENMQ